MDWCLGSFGGTQLSVQQCSSLSWYIRMDHVVQRCAIVFLLLKKVSSLVQEIRFSLKTIGHQVMRWQNDACCWRSMQDTNSCSHHGQDPWSISTMHAYDQSISGGILSGSNLNSENWRPVVNTSIYWPSICTSFSSSHDSTTHTSSSSYNKRGRNQKWWKWNKNDEKIKEKKSKEEERRKCGFCGFSLQLKTSLISCAPFPCIIRPSKSKRKLFRTNCEDHNQTTNW